MIRPSLVLVPLMLVTAMAGCSATATTGSEVPSESPSTSRTESTSARSATSAVPSPTLQTQAAAGILTCSQYASLAPDTGLGATVTEPQIAAIKIMLARHNRELSDQNVTASSLQIIAYCDIYGGRSGTNQSMPIDGIPGLQ